MASRIRVRSAAGEQRRRAAAEEDARRGRERRSARRCSRSATHASTYASTRWRAVGPRARSRSSRSDARRTGCGRRRRTPRRQATSVQPAVSVRAARAQATVPSAIGSLRRLTGTPPASSTVSAKPATGPVDLEGRRRSGRTEHAGRDRRGHRRRRRSIAHSWYVSLVGQRREVVVHEVAGAVGQDDDRRAAPWSDDEVAPARAPSTSVASFELLPRRLAVGCVRLVEIVVQRHDLRPRARWRRPQRPRQRPRRSTPSRRRTPRAAPRRELVAARARRRRRRLDVGFDARPELGRRGLVHRRARRRARRRSRAGRRPRRGPARLPVEVLLDQLALVGLEGVEHVRAEERVHLGAGLDGVVTGALPRR